MSSMSADVASRYRFASNRGQAATEYLVVVAAIAAALFGPLLDGASPAQRLVEALASAYRAFALVVALQ